MNQFIKKFNIVYVSLITLIFYGSLSITSKSTNCSLPKNKKICSIASTITKPSHILLNGLIETKRFLKREPSNNLVAYDPQNTIRRFENADLKSGFNFYYDPGVRENAGFLLLAAADPENNGYPFIELWDMNQQKKIHRYPIDMYRIYKNLDIKIVNPKRVQFKHPLLLDDGSLLTRAEGKIIRIDKCGNLIASNKVINSHHSLEADKKGNIYTPVFFDKETIKNYEEYHSGGFINDGFAILDKNLKLKKSYSLLEIYKINNLLPDIYGNQTLIDDPFHLNDVQPYLSNNGKNKNVILSMRGHSRIMSVDLENLKVNWFVDRATYLQHDVDIIKQNTNSLDISIFDNNTGMFSAGKEINFGNRIAYLYNLPKNSNKESFNIGDKSAFKKYGLKYLDFNSIKNLLKPKTRNEGLSDHLIKNGSVMVEETNFGRLLEVELITGKLLWQYYNKNENTDPYMMNWSRRFEKLPKFLNPNIFKACNFLENTN